MNAQDQSNTGTGTSPAPSPRSTSALGAAGIARRRLFQGGAAGAGVLLSSPARSALNLTGCESPSAAFSGNLSRPVGGPDVCGSSTGGRSPGYWGRPQHFPSWPVPLPSILGGAADCTMNAGDANKLKLSDLQGGATVDVEFGFRPKLTDGTTPPQAVPLLAALLPQFSFQANANGNYLFHLTAMFLNASKFTGGSQTYPMTPQQVRDFARVLFVGGTFCPAGTSCGGAKPAWSALEVKEYIDYWIKKYDDNSDLVNLCKANP